MRSGESGREGRGGSSFRGFIDTDGVDLCRRNLGSGLEGALGLDLGSDS